MSRGLPHSFRCGDWVYDPIDPRHIGRIKLIDSGLFVVVEWRKGLASQLSISHICKVTDRERSQDR